MFQAVADMAIGAGPLYTTALMGQTLSAAEAEHARKASSSILRQHTISVEESDNVSRPDSFSVHYDCTRQAPYADGEMMTQGSLLHLPRDNPSHELAYFLKSTGPTQPHRRPSRLEGRVSSLRRRGLGFLRPRRTPSYASAGVTRQRSMSTGLSRLFRSGADNEEEIDFRDEGGLLADVSLLTDLPAQQKVSLDGTKYMALKVGNEKEEGDVGMEIEVDEPEGQEQEPIVLESRVSVLMVPPDDPESSGDGNGTVRRRPGARPPTPATELGQYVPCNDDTTRRVERWGTPEPVHLAVSNPTTPEPASAISASYSFWSETERSNAKRSFDTDRILSRSLSQAKKGASASLPNVLQAFNPSAGEEEGSMASRFAEMRHPTPVRFASHPVLLQTNASIASAMSARSASESPGLPPRSPLRLQRAAQSSEAATQVVQPEAKKTTRTAPSIMSMDEYNKESPIIRPTIVTDCTGPIKRPKSRGKDRSAPYTPSKARTREDRFRPRRMRDRPAPAHTTIDAVVHASPPVPRQRLRKARPHIQIPKMQATPPAVRASSSTSSSASGKKITEYTRTPVSAVPSADVTSISEKTASTPISPLSSTVSRKEMTPAKLMAEEKALPTPSKLVPRPARIRVLKDGKSYGARPRSASLPSHVKTRSRHGGRTPSRPNTPMRQSSSEERAPPPIPSPPPIEAYEAERVRDVPSLPSTENYETQRVLSLPYPPATAAYHPDRVLPLPSPPPTCALPPIPLPPGPSRPAPKAKQPLHPPPPPIRTDISLVPWPNGSVDMSSPERPPQVMYKKYPRKPVPASTTTTGGGGGGKETADLYARVEALERKNNLLRDQLHNMIITGGGLYGRRSMDAGRRQVPMVWETRIARRGAASKFEPEGGKAGYDIYWGHRR